MYTQLQVHGVQLKRGLLTKP